MVEHTARIAWAVGLLSAAMLAYEVSLMRWLLVASWHHFAFLVISIALLGFGASGTALCLLRRWLATPRSLVWLAAGAALAMPLCAVLAQSIPLEARFLPALFWKQLGAWAACWGLLFVPFLIGATFIGSALMQAGQRVARVYAASLIGSGIGAMASPLVLWAVPTSHIRPDPFKYSAFVARLANQGDAQRLMTVRTPRSTVELWRSALFHDMPALSLGAAPPAMDAIVVDGHLAGTLLRIASLDQAAVVDQSLMSFGYAVAPSRRRVLLLGETGGVNAWAAARAGAFDIDWVQGDAGVIDVLRGRPVNEGGAVVQLPGVRLIHSEPRHWVAQRPPQYDLIQLCSLEGSAAGSGGMLGLGQDHLITVEGLVECLRCLSDRGLLVAGRGIQTPPRDNVKLLATMIQAMGRVGIQRPGDHLVVVRDYQWVCLVASRSPLDAAQVARVDRACAARQLTPVWYPGVRPERLNQPDALPSPPGEVGDWYHKAVTELLSPRAAAFIDRWVYDVRPPTDDRPFFLDFLKLESLATIRRSFGDLWLARTELALLFVLGAGAVVAAAGLVLIVMPLLGDRDLRAASGKAATAGYFAAIGLAYLSIEIVLLSRTARLIGDPVQSAALTIATMLVMSGIGSAMAGRCVRGGVLALRAGVGGLIVAGMGLLLVFDPLCNVAAGWSLVARCTLAVGLIAPLALLMGLPMPLALRRLNDARPALIPWAWGINGFASVLASPLATIIGMSWGFSYAATAALALYATAAVLFPRLSAAHAPTPSLPDAK